MKHPIFILAVALFGANCATTHASELTLVAKCGFPDNPQEDVIRPGTPFVYFFEDASGQLYVVDSIANKEEQIAEREAGLAGDIAPVEARGEIGGRVDWSQPDLTRSAGDEENWMNLGGERGTVFISSGRSSYTAHAYPSCIVFSD
jgi:hypothetical protein